MSPGGDLEQTDRDLRKRIVELARERGECESMVAHYDGQLSMGNRGPTETQNLFDDRQKNIDRVQKIIAEMDEIHAERVRLGLAS